MRAGFGVYPSLIILGLLGFAFLSIPLLSAACLTFISFVVGKGRLELPRLSAHDPKSCSSANSDTSPRAAYANSGGYAYYSNGRLCGANARGGRVAFHSSSLVVSTISAAADERNAIQIPCALSPRRPQPSPQISCPRQAARRASLARPRNNPLTATLSAHYRAFISYLKLCKKLCKKPC